MKKKHGKMWRNWYCSSKPVLKCVEMKKKHEKSWRNGYCSSKPVLKSAKVIKGGNMGICVSMIWSFDQTTCTNYFAIRY